MSYELINPDGYRKSPPAKVAKFKSLKIQRRRIENRADGSSFSSEEMFQMDSDMNLQGEDWIYNEQGEPGKDLDRDHFRSDREKVVVKKRTVIDDGQGNRICDEFSSISDEGEDSTGTRMIRKLGPPPPQKLEQANRGFLPPPKWRR